MIACLQQGQSTGTTPQQAELVRHLAGEGLITFEAVGLVTDQQVTGAVACEALSVQAEGLVGDNEHLLMSYHISALLARPDQSSGVAGG